VSKRSRESARKRELNGLNRLNKLNKGEYAVVTRKESQPKGLSQVVLNRRDAMTAEKNLRGMPNFDG